jgi:putative restriction endonuclease
VKYWLGVTDNEWFDFLSHQQPDEVNFWQPSGKAPFIGLEPGAPFLFKLKRPFNHVAGGGYFVKFSALPLSMVWDTFGYKNGAASRAAFEIMIRRLAPDPRAKDPYVGCTILTEPFFWPREKWIEAPKDWTRNIVRGRYYDSRISEGARLWTFVEASRQVQPVIQEAPARYGEPTMVKPRLGQGAFRVVVTDAYQRRCAITGESTLPVLEAAHILPFAEHGPNEVGNGLLLRSDFHKLFDLGLVTVTPELNIEISPQIREEWFNGEAYYRLHGQRLASVPNQAAHHPAPDFLRWHNDNRFQG